VTLAAAAALLFCCLTTAMLRSGRAAFDGAVRTVAHERAAQWLTPCVETMTLFRSLGVLDVLGGVSVVVQAQPGLPGDTPRS
jgi:hypothetical protein